MVMHPYTGVDFAADLKEFEDGSATNQRVSPGLN
jgi:hypothetical protein